MCIWIWYSERHNLVLQVFYWSLCDSVNLFMQKNWRCIHELKCFGVVFLLANEQNHSLYSKSFRWYYFTWNASMESYQRTRCMLRVLRVYNSALSLSLSLSCHVHTESNFQFCGNCLPHGYTFSPVRLVYQKHGSIRFKSPSSSSLSPIPMYIHMNVCNEQRHIYLKLLNVVIQYAVQANEDQAMIAFHYCFHSRAAMYVRVFTNGPFQCYLSYLYFSSFPAYS